MLNEIDKYKRSIAQKVRALRLGRRWTQDDLAQQLGLSQSRLSEIERGKGSFTAEQLLMIMRIFNVPVTHFASLATDHDLELQNALARLGARHLRESEHTLPEHLEVTDVVRRALISGLPRQITALAPVLVCNIDRLNLQGLNLQLIEAGLRSRLAWLVDNTLEAIRHELKTPQSRSWGRQLRRAEVLLGSFLEPLQVRPREAAVPPDILDVDIRSARTLSEVRSASSASSRRWEVVTRLQPEDFILALKEARTDD